MEFEYIVVAQFSPTTPTGERLVVPGKNLIEDQTKTVLNGDRIDPGGDHT